MSIDIERPEGISKSDLTHLFLSARNLDSFWPIESGEQRYIYAKLQFTEKEISEVKTRFKSKTLYRDPPALRMSRKKYERDLLGPTDRFEPEAVHLKAEGNVILLFTKEADFESEAKNKNDSS